MKILAIRGCNLASLRGHFELDLAAEPFASAGLFAITGPTGAGKSTLLDALCLALFDKTPRLDGSGGAWVGRADEEETQRIRSKDVRGLLTRGQAHAFAEVDFASQDGRRWRARWEVRKARDSARGRLQPQKLSLQDLDSGGFVGDKKTQVREAIQERIGLSFEQFRRSVLLAQGDFDAFLRAAPPARAELLEKVTGTEIYARLSAAAFERAKVERNTLDALNLQRSNLGLLSPEARHEAEQHLEKASATLVEAKRALDSAVTAVQWYAERSRLCGLEDKGNRKSLEAAERWQKAAERREVLRQVSAAQPLRSLVDHQDRALERRDQAIQRLDEERDHQQDASEGFTKASRQLDKARLDQERVQLESETKAPELEKALLLDARLVAAQREVDDATDAAASTNLAAQQATKTAADAAQAKDEAQQKQAIAEGWLKDHPHAQALSGAWTHLRAALGDYSQAETVLAELDQSLPSLESAALRATRDAEATSATLDTAKQHLERCQQAVEGAEAAIPKGRRDKLAGQRATFQRRWDSAREAKQALTDIQRARVAQQRAEQEAQAAREQQLAAQEVIEATAAALRDHAIRLDEASSSLREAEAIRDLAERRSDLVDGEPCPLCGSTAHPFQHDGAPDALASQKQRVQSLEEQSQQLTAELTGAQHQVKTHEQEIRKQTEQAAQANEQLTAPLKSWQEALDTIQQIGQPELELPDDPRSAGAEATLERLVSMARQELDNVEQKEEDLGELDKAAATCRKARDAARQQHDECNVSREIAKAAAQRAEDALAEAMRLREAEHRRIGAAKKSLETSLNARPGWEEQLDQDNHAFRESCQQEVDDFDQQTQAHELACAALAELSPRAVKVATEARAAKDSAAKQEELARQLCANRDTLLSERSLLLGGEPVADVKRALAAASTAADQALDSARVMEREARDRSQTTEANVENARQQLRTEASALQDAESALQVALTEHGIDLAILRQRLQRDAAWCDDEARHLERIHQAVQEAQTVLEERRARREEHENSDHPELSESEATSQQQIAAEDHQRADEAAQSLRLKIRLDDDAREKSALLATDIARQGAQSALWEKLTEVIGSRDGGKFRKFAQGLTLDTLLAFANEHLRQLAPRYRLERVPGEDLELQVIDCDMGDDVRSIKSLSGGETFLASLALALGLSSLSASETLVESLFIDEGFGTLDSQTLEIALSAFDALRASGHQIGIISHVQDLDQRIGVQVRIVKVGAGRSRLETVSEM